MRHNYQRYNHLSLRFDIPEYSIEYSPEFQRRSLRLTNTPLASTRVSESAMISEF